LCAFAVALVAAAGVRAEPLLVTVEGTGAAALTAPQSDEFGPGGTAAAGVLLPVAPRLLLGVRLRAGVLSSGDPPINAGRVNPGVGTFESASGVLRLRPFADDADVRRAVGLFLELSGGGTLTGKDTVRGHAGGGLGYGFATGALGLAPVVRYEQVVQPSHPLSDEDARLLLFGVELTFLDARPVAEPPTKAEAPPSDRDGDGIVDEDDACPDAPEDVDGFQDEDGCPDPDNDGDGKLDPDDECPNEPEDVDGYKDEDGCPDPDNDQDGFPDADDQCPNEAEVVNGNKDYDGCPDEGLIQMRDDRIVLEERVLFDFERARVKQAARPILHAIVTLFEQHPEWTRIRIEGHADTRGSEEYNQSLSQRRADNVRELLVRYGIPAGIIEAVGFGSTRPRDLRDEIEAHDRNRRVEFVVVARHQVALPAAAPRAPEAKPEAAGEAGGEESEEAAQP
jgi:outer membrane protein OmpA-like peptidoglycan-associated protein